MLKAKERLGKTVTIRKEPRAVAGNSINESISPYSTIDYIAIVPDMDYLNDATKQWLDLGGGRYCNYIYPPSGLRFDLLPENTTNEYILHVVQNPDGTMTVTKYIPQ